MPNKDKVFQQSIERVKSDIKSQQDRIEFHVDELTSEVAEGIQQTKRKLEDSLEWFNPKTHLDSAKKYCSENSVTLAATALGIGATIGFQMRSNPQTKYRQLNTPPPTTTPRLTSVFFNLLASAIIEKSINYFLNQPLRRSAVDPRPTTQTDTHDHGSVMTHEPSNFYHH